MSAGVAGVLAVVLTLHLGMTAAAEEARVVCGADRPVAAPNGSVEVSAVTDVPAADPPQFRWTASAGGFRGRTGQRQATGGAVSWSPDGAKPGPYLLSVTLSGASGSVGRCSVEVLVVRTLRSAGAPAADELGSQAERAMLPQGTAERPGYGLYSYILFGTRPDDASRDRFRAVLKEYLRLEDTQLESYFKTEALNITYVPVGAGSNPQADVDWLIDHYDYARARFLLSRLRPGDREGDGPFIVSALRPLGSDAGPTSYLVQNLSTVPLEMVPNWMRAFRTQTTQQRVWQSRSIGGLALNLRTVIAVAGVGLPSVKESVKSWINVREGS